jgi:hypothetical protein
MALPDDSWWLASMSVLFGGIAVAFYAICDFHYPYARTEIPYSVRRIRFILAVSAYVLTALMAYVLLGSLFYLVGRLSYPEGDIDVLSESLTVSLSALAATLILTIALPSIPQYRRAISKIRGAAHAIALYPTERETFVQILTQSPHAPASPDGNLFSDELAGYRVERDAIATLNSDVLIVLEELWDLRARFNEIRKSTKYESWFEARGSALDEVDLELTRLAKRIATALHDTKPSDNADRLPQAVSRFITNESEPLMRRLRTLIAELLLSGPTTPEEREKLFRSFGYIAPLPDTLPVSPLILIVGIFPFEFLMLGIAYAFGMLGPMSLRNAMTLALVRAVCLIAAASWSIFPKVLTTFARPSSHSRPWAWYFLSSAACFICTFAIFFLLWLAIGDARSRLAGQFGGILYSSAFLAFYNALMFAAITFVVSYRTDSHLMTFNPTKERRKWRDAIILGCLTSGFAALFYEVMAEISNRSFMDILSLRWVLALGLEGMLIGYFLPSAAATHIEARAGNARTMNAPAELTERLRMRNPAHRKVAKATIGEPL